jgi:predicted RNA-binding Zn-ribbon protein involved in translation (DUF1610 family)
MDEGHQINGKASIKVNIVTERERGVLWLCSDYGCHAHENDIELRESEIVKFYCPKCNKSLMRDVNCKMCDADMVGFNIKAGGKVNICSRMGCENHYVVFEDLHSAISKFYQEYGVSG